MTQQILTEMRKDLARMNVLAVRGQLTPGLFRLCLDKLNRSIATLENGPVVVIDAPPTQAEPVADFDETLQRLSALRDAIRREMGPGSGPGLLRGRAGRIFIDEFAHDQESPPLDLSDHDYRRWAAGLPASRFRNPNRVAPPSAEERAATRHPMRRVRGLGVVDGDRK